MIFSRHLQTTPLQLKVLKCMVYKSVAESQKSFLPPLARIVLGINDFDVSPSALKAAFCR